MKKKVIICCMLLHIGMQSANCSETNDMDAGGIVSDLKRITATNMDPCEQLKDIVCRQAARLATRRKRRQFTPEEDCKLKTIVEQHGTSNWTLIAELMQTRNTRQCRERYCHYLDPNINKNPYTEEEDNAIKRLVRKHGHNWYIVARELGTNRTSASVKNRWYGMRDIWQKGYSHDMMWPNRGMLEISPIYQVWETEREAQESNERIEPIEDVIEIENQQINDWADGLCDPTEGDDYML